MSRGYRFLFTGHARVGQRRLTNLLALYLARELGAFKGELPNSDHEIEKAATGDSVRQVVIGGRDMCVESILAEGGREIEVFLDAGDQRRQLQEWRDAFKKILERAEQHPDKHLLISMHGLYYRRTRFYSLLDLDLLRQLQPDLVITVTDDIQSVWHRIRKRGEMSPAKTRFRLSELLTWRTAELLFSDLMAAETVKSEYALKSHKMKNYLLAAKHPVHMLYRLLFEPAILKVYASFPISAVRKSDPSEMEARRTAIDNFRKALHAKYAVFDPITIDEKIIEFASRRPDGNYELPAAGIPVNASRWSLGFDDPLVPDEKGCYPLLLPDEDVADVIRLNPDTGRSPIDDHIRFRDYRLIDQSDCVAAFRPNFHRQPSVGMSDELRHAQYTMVPAYGFNPSEDQIGNPFGDLLTSNCDTLGEVFEMLERHQARKSEND